MSYTILVPLNLEPGPSATNYNPPAQERAIGGTALRHRNIVKPVQGFQCTVATAGSVVKLTPTGAANVILTDAPGGTGTGGRLRVACDGNGIMTAVEIAEGGSGYTTGPISAVIEDAFGEGGVIAVTAAGGSITDASIVSPGINYAGYITYDSGDFIEGVVYNICTRYVEITSGSLANLSLVGFRS